jgi:serine protein kinase
MRVDEGIFGLYSRLYENRREVEYSLEDYLRGCSDDTAFYAGPAERLLKAIGEPLMVDTAQDPPSAASL